MGQLHMFWTSKLSYDLCFSSCQKGKGSFGREQPSDKVTWGARMEPELIPQWRPGEIV